MRDDLPALLAEIAEVTDLATALAVAEAAGGTTVTFVARLTPENWLVKAVGLDKAQRISRQITSGKARVKLFVPLGPRAGTYRAEQRRRAALLYQAEQDGLSARQAARKAGITDRSVHRFRARLARRHNKDQGWLF